MAKLILNEFNVRRALKNIQERYGDWMNQDDVNTQAYKGNEGDWDTPEEGATDVTSAAFDRMDSAEKLPQGWERMDRDGDSPLYRDPDYNEYTKDEYGNFNPVENEEPVEDEGINPNSYYLISDGSSFPIYVKLKGEYIYMCAQGMGRDSAEDIPEVMQIPEVQSELSKISDEELDKWWGESYFDGMSEEEKLSADRDTKLMYFLWSASWNAQDGDYETVDEMSMLKEAIKHMIRESINNMGGFQSMYPMGGGDMMEKYHTKKSKHSQFNQHYKTNPKTARQARQTKRAIVIKWLRDPQVNCAEIMRQLWNPTPEDEDTKRGEFYKKRDGKINKDTGARYSFSEEEINTLYRIKSSSK